MDDIQPKCKYCDRFSDIRIEHDDENVFLCKKHEEFLKNLLQG